MTPKEATSLIKQALRRLEASEGAGPRSRRNAKKAMARALRAMKGACEIAFPPPARKSGKTGPRLSGVGRVNKLRRDGWAELLSEVDPRLVELALVGIKVKRVKFSLNDGVRRTYLFAPPWTRGIPGDRLAEARKSHLRRNAIAAETQMRHEARHPAKPVRI